MQPDFRKGLVPAILQHAKTKEVLMLGYMNEEAFQRTMETNEVWFYSRSKQRLWKKGETSGNVQKVVEWALDCDQDAILLKVLPEGPACHKGSDSCFRDPQTPAPFSLEELIAKIRKKKKQGEENSYTNYLFREGKDKICKKFAEEATEVILANKNQDPEELAKEGADLIYHFLVLLEEGNSSWEAVLQVLEERHAKEGNRKPERRPIDHW